MTVQTEATFSGPLFPNGATTSFPFDFAARAAGDVQVRIDDAVISSALYSVQLAADFNSGAVVFTVAPDAGGEMYIVSVPSFEQQISFKNQASFFPASHDDANDRAAIRDLYLKGKAERALLVPLGELPAELPAAADRAGSFLAFDINGDPYPADGTGADGALRSDLASILAGAGIVATRTSGTGAITRSVLAKLTDAPLTPYDFGRGIPGITDTVALRRALEAGVAQGRAVDLVSGTYALTELIAISAPNKKVRILNSGGAKIVCTTGGGLLFYGVAAQVQALNAIAYEGSVSFTQASASSFAAGDWGTFYDPTDYSFAAFTVATGYGDDRPTYRKGEFFQVQSVGGAVVNVRSSLRDTYGTGSTDVYKVSPVEVAIDALWIVGDGSSDFLLKVDYGLNTQIDKAIVRAAGLAGVVLSRCLDGNIDSADIVNTGLGGVDDDDYGLSLSSCQGIRPTGGRYWSRRHGITSGNSDQINCVPCRDCVPTGAMIDNDRASGIHAADIHGCADACGFIDCLIPGGVGLAGKNPFVRRSRIGSVEQGIAVLGYELIGNGFDVTDNVISVFADPIVNSRGVIDLAGGIGPGMTKALIPTVKGNAFVSAALSATTRIVSIENNGATVAISPDVTDNDLLSINNFGSMLFMKLGTGAAASGRIRVKRNTTSLSGKYVLLDGGTAGNANAYANLPVLCMPEQNLTASFTTNTGVSNQASAVLPFKWQYPRMPVVNVGGADRTYVGTKGIVTSKTSVTATGASLVIGTADNTNWASALAVNVSATVSLEEV